MSQLQRLQSKVEKLSLMKGDILICRDYETMQRLADLQISGIDFIIPVVLAPDGVAKLTRQQLKEILKSLPPEPQ